MHEEINFTKNVEQVPRPLYIERMKIRCRHCGHRFAIKAKYIKSIKDAVYLCEYCEKPVK